MAQLLCAGLVSSNPVRVARRAVDAAPRTSHGAARSDCDEHLAQELNHRQHGAAVAHRGHGFDRFHESASAKVGEATVGLRCIDFTRTTHAPGCYLLYRSEFYGRSCPDKNRFDRTWVDHH